MKLSKENRKRQEAIRKALAAGKPLGGVLAGLLSVAVAGCGRDHSPASTMGSYPNSSTCTNSVNENPRRVPMGDLKENAPAPQPKRRSRRDASMMGKYIIDPERKPAERKPTETKPAEAKPEPSEKTGK